MPHGEIDHAAGAHDLQELFLKVAVQRLELRAGVLVLGADGQNLVHRAFGKNDDPVLGHLELSSALRDEQAILDLDLQVRIASAEIVQIALHLVLDLVHLGEKRDHVQGLVQALGDLSSRLARPGGLEVRIVDLHVDLARRVHEQRAIDRRQDQRQPGNGRRAHPTRLGPLGVTHRQESAFGEQHRNDCQSHERDPGDRQDSGDTLLAVRFEAAQAETFEPPIRRRGVEQERHDARRAQHGQKLFDIAPLSAHPVLGQEANERGTDHGEHAQQRHDPLTRRHRLQDVLADVDEDQAKDVGGDHPQRCGPTAARLGKNAGGLGSIRFLRGRIVGLFGFGLRLLLVRIGSAIRVRCVRVRCVRVALVVVHRHRRASSVLVAASKKKNVTIT